MQGKVVTFHGTTAVLDEEWIATRLLLSVATIKTMELQVITVAMIVEFGPKLSSEHKLSSWVHAEWRDSYRFFLEAVWLHTKTYTISK